MTDITKKSKVKFPHMLPFRCTDDMFLQLKEKVERLGFDSISSYLRVLVHKDLRLNYIQDLE